MNWIKILWAYHTTTALLYYCTTASRYSHIIHFSTEENNIDKDQSWVKSSWFIHFAFDQLNLIVPSECPISTSWHNWKCV